MEAEGDLVDGGVEERVFNPFVSLNEGKSRPWITTITVNSFHLQQSLFQKKN